MRVTIVESTKCHDCDHDQIVVQLPAWVDVTDAAVMQRVADQAFAEIKKYRLGGADA